MVLLLCLLWAWLSSALVPRVHGYVPAQGTNSTSLAIASGLNVSDVSTLYLHWHLNGSYQEHVSYQLVGGDNSSGISQGAIVHFSEAKANESTPGSLTPWIALISCDTNATDASQDEDIFTLARNKGAVAALLYSLTAAACIINPEYADPENFDQVFDIFSTQSLSAAETIEYQFGQVNETLYSFYNSQRLNESYDTIAESIQTMRSVKPGYLFATLVAYNASNASAYNNVDATPGAPSSSQKSGSNTALAMIILYAITGCVSALFCVVIISGAVRAIRHPERYGPRSAGRHGLGDGQQSRARGLTRAILDTFPVVKFGSSQHDTEAGVKNIQETEFDAPSGVEMKKIASEESLQAVSHPLPGDVEATEQHASGSSELATASASPRLRIRKTPVADGSDVVPDSIGRETCPICIVDFEEGDDLRLLPCEGKHRFHQDCVDPWLLELSSSCPICRHDFLALEQLLSEPNESQDPPESPSTAQHTSRGARFSRYIRQAVRRRREREQEEDPTYDSDLPAAPTTTL
ncbi:hypothetical protein C8J56DRAFT_965107 [Mycena floridula]|nr:hypothetical protein C8J56DRAFT_965107 [Mycena floridula]